MKASNVRFCHTRNKKDVVKLKRALEQAESVAAGAAPVRVVQPFRRILASGALGMGVIPDSLFPPQNDRANTYRPSQALGRASLEHVQFNLAHRKAFAQQPPHRRALGRRVHDTRGWFAPTNP